MCTFGVFFVKAVKTSELTKVEDSLTLYDEFKNSLLTPSTLTNVARAEMLIDYSYTGATTSWALLISTFAFEAPSTDIMLEVSFNAKGIKRSARTSNGLNVPNPTACIFRPLSSYNRNLSALNNYDPNESEAEKSSAFPSQAFVQAVEDYNTEYTNDNPDYSPQDGVHVIASANVERTTLIFPYSLATGQGIAIVCSNDVILGSHKAPLYDDGPQKNYVGPLLIPFLFSITTLEGPSILTHGVAQVPPISLGIPRYELNREESEDRRLFVSLHKGIENTTEYDLTSPIVLDSASPDRTPYAGIVLDQLTEIPALTPFALRIHFPSFGLDLSEPNSSEERGFQAGTYMIGLERISFASTSLEKLTSSGWHLAGFLTISYPNESIREVKLLGYLSQIDEISLLPI